MTDKLGRLALVPAVLALCWGLNWPAVKIMLGSLPPFTLRWAGLGMAGVVLLVYAAARGRSLRPAEGSRWALVASALLNVAAFNICTAIAQLNTSTSRAAVLTYTMPMMSAAVAWVLLGERPKPRTTAALLLGGAGIAVLAGPALALAGTASTLGLAMPLLAALAWALGTVVAKRWPVDGDHAVAIGWQLVIGGACAAIGAALLGERWPDEVPARVWAALGFHIFIATSLAYVLWFMLLQRLPATVASLTTWMVPVVGVLGAMVLVGDRPAVADFLGFALVLGGAALVVLKARPAS